MLRPHDPSALHLVEDPDVRRLLERRLAEILDGEPHDPDRHGEWILIEPGDGAKSLDAKSGTAIADVCWQLRWTARLRRTASCATSA